jgi:ubiquinone/menaquinone biosynthesis C-methylase UbiE
MVFSVPQFVQRAFWSLYGQSVWDNYVADTRTPLIEAIQATLQAREAVSGQHILDAGCGTGTVSLALVMSGFQVTAADFAPGMLRRLDDKSKSLEISTSALHIIPINLSQQLPWTTAIFDHVLLIGVLQVLPEPEKTLRALANLLHPGWKCYCGTPLSPRTIYQHAS